MALGEQLFRDPRLSKDNAQSCFTCHDTRTNAANAHDLSPGVRPKALNTPTIFNAALNFRLNWEENFRSLERHAENTLRDPARMGSQLDEVLNRLRADPEAVQQFRDAYGREPDVAALLDAIATYERSLLTSGSRFDRWLEGDDGAITPEELPGYQLFKSLGCISCHQGVNVGGNLFQRHGIFHPRLGFFTVDPTRPSPGHTWIRRRQGVEGHGFPAARDAACRRRGGQCYRAGISRT